MCIVVASCSWYVAGKDMSQSGVSVACCMSVVDNG